ncbi:phospholipase-like protein [Tanacetum coccineum]
MQGLSSNTNGSEEDEEKTASYTVDKAFSKQIGRNLKACADDMVIKNKSEEDLLLDIQETFDQPRAINMKLNPKSMFLLAWMGWNADTEGRELGELYKTRDCKRAFESIDDLAAWNDFPWGEHMWIELHHRGFVFAFKIWILEMFPNSKTWWIQEKNVIPRVVAWSDETQFLKSDYDCLFHVRNRIGTLSPSSDEMKQPWWKKSLDYFHNVSKAIISSDVPVLTKKSRLSVQDLTKKIFHMHRDFQSRITAIEQAVNQHKTSEIGSDSDGSNVFSTTMEFDPDVSCLTENPHNRVALTKKITDMEVQFQRRITLIEEYLKMSRSAHLEKMSNVAAECMFVDPSTSCATDLNGNTFHSDSMDVDPDRKVQRDAKMNWTEAYFPINGENNHWVLAELHFRSGVITIYDSLPPQNTLVESRKWWLDMRQCYAEKFPKLLI